MRDLSKIILVSLLLNSTSAFATCDTSEIDISFKVDYGKVDYKSVENSYLKKKSSHIMGANKKVRGLTVASFSDSMQSSFSISQQDTTVCVFPSAIKVYLGYKNLDVFVDDKYMKNTCEYKTVLGHEQQHVKIYQSGLKKYAKSISKRIYDLLQDIEPLEKDFYSGEINQSKVNEFSAIMNATIREKLDRDENLQALKKTMNDYINNFNTSLDSHDNYNKTQKRCDNW